MEKLISISIIIIFLLIAMISIVKIWYNQIIVKLSMRNLNIAFHIFISAQIFQFLLINIISIDSNTLTSIENFKPFENKENYIYWSVISVYFAGLFFIFLISNLLSKIIMKYVFKIIRIKNEILENNWGSTLTYNMISISIAIIFSYFLFRPFLFNLVYENTRFGVIF